MSNCNPLTPKTSSFVFFVFSGTLFAALERPVLKKHRRAPPALLLDSKLDVGVEIKYSVCVMSSVWHKLLQRAHTRQHAIPDGSARHVA